VCCVYGYVQASYLSTEYNIKLPTKPVSDPSSIPPTDVSSSNSSNNLPAVNGGTQEEKKLKIKLKSTQISKITVTYCEDSDIKLFENKPSFYDLRIQQGQTSHSSSPSSSGPSRGLGLNSPTWLTIQKNECKYLTSPHSTERQVLQMGVVPWVAEEGKDQKETTGVSEGSESIPAMRPGDSLGVLCPNRSQQV